MAVLCGECVNYGLFKGTSQSDTYHTFQVSTLDRETMSPQAACAFSQSRAGPFWATGTCQSREIA